MEETEIKTPHKTPFLTNSSVLSSVRDVLFYDRPERLFPCRDLQTFRILVIGHLSWRRQQVVSGSRAAALRSALCSHHVTLMRSEVLSCEEQTLRWAHKPNDCSGAVWAQVTQRAGQCDRHNGCAPLQAALPSFLPAGCRAADRTDVGADWNGAVCCIRLCTLLLTSGCCCSGDFASSWEAARNLVALSAGFLLLFKRLVH